MPETTDSVELYIVYNFILYKHMYDKLQFIRHSNSNNKYNETEQLQSYAIRVM
jgi:hypothetical protein